MPQSQVQIHETVRAPIDQVFTLFADHDRFAALFGGTSRRMREGNGDANGVGSVRRIGRGLFSFDETVMVFDKPSRIEYAITRGSLLKNHNGTIVFQANEGQTSVDYVIRFDSRIPGLGRLFVRMFLRAWENNGRTLLAHLAST